MFRLCQFFLIARIFAQFMSPYIFQFCREGERKFSEGLASPTNTEARAVPASEPRNQPCTMAGTSFTQGIATALPEILTTIRFYSPLRVH